MTPPGEGRRCQIGSGIYGGSCVSVLCGHLNEPPVLIFFNVSASENHQFQVFEKKKSESMNCGSPLFQKPLKKLVIFMKEALKNPQFSGPSYLIFSIFLRNVIICQNQVLCSLRTMVLIPMNRPDNHQGSVPISNNCPIPLSCKCEICF